jgi:hypothetical protein
LQAGILTNNFTVTGLTQGLTYAFTVQARNSYGYSDPSLSVSVLAAQLPAVPTTPTTAYQNNGTSIYISWPATDNGGSAITSYTVKIRHNDGTTFTASTTACSGFSQFVLANRACYVPVSVVLAAPYNLPWTSSIDVHPVPGTLLLFFSQGLSHEVLVTSVKRYAVICWFRIRAAQRNKPLFAPVLL